MIRIVTLLLFTLSLNAFAQEPPKVVMHLQTADTMVYKSMVNQISNVKKQLPGALVEVVCHGPGLNFLMKDSPYAARINNMNLSNVEFIGCEFTMKSKNIQKSDLAPFAGTVPYGIVEILKKQQEDWLYVKLGF